MPRALKFICVIVVAFTFGIFSSRAEALDAYNSAQQAQFMDWCTGKMTNTKSTCSCALENLAVTVPPAALATYLSSEQGSGGFSLSTTTATTAALVTQALTQCVR